MIKRKEDVAHRFSSNGKKGEFLDGTEGREGEWKGKERKKKGEERDEMYDEAFVRARFLFEKPSVETDIKDA